mgnify:CR=1 FL=1
MILFTTLTYISTRYTYFERYQDMWDIMITLKDTELTFLAGIHAEKITVKNEMKTVAANIDG